MAPHILRLESVSLMTWLLRNQPKQVEISSWPLHNTFRDTDQRCVTLSSTPGNKHVHLDERKAGNPAFLITN